MADITFDSLVQKVDDRFRSFTVEFNGEVIEFENPGRRRTKEGRKRYRDIIKKFPTSEEFEAEDADGEKLQERTLRVIKELMKDVCVQGNFDALAEALGDSFPHWNGLMEEYQERLKVGEASPSQS